MSTLSTDRIQGAPASRLAWSVLLPYGLLTLGLGLVVVWTVGLMNIWAFSNDAMNNLRFSFPVDTASPFVQTFQKAAEDNCLGVQRCINDTRVVLLSNISLNYPIVVPVSEWLASAVKVGGLLDAMLKAFLIASLAGAIIAALIGGVWLAQAPPAIIAPVGIALILFAFLPLMGVGASLGLPEFLLHPLFFSQYNSAGGLIVAVAATAIGLLVIARTARRLVQYRTVLKIRHWILRPSIETWSYVSVALLGALILSRVLGVTGAPFFVTTGAIAATLFVVVSVRLRVPALIAFTLFFIAASGVSRAYFYFNPTMPSPLGAMTFAASAWLILAAIAPKNRWLLLMPVLPCLHVAGAGLFALTVLVSELCLCLVRRRPSQILVISAITAVLSVAFSMFGQSGALVGDGETSALPTLLQAIVAEPLEGLARISPFVVAAFYLLLCGRGHFDASARAALMCGALAAWLHISAGLIRIGIDPIDPTFHVYAYIFSYLGPCLGFAIPLAVMTDLLRHPNLGAGNGTWLSARSVVVCCAVLFLVMWRGDYYLRQADGPVTALRDGLHMIMNPSAWTAADPMLHCLDFSDDTYLLRISPEQRPNDPLTYASYLKFVLRKETGDFNPATARILVTDAREGYRWHAVQSLIAEKSNAKPPDCPKADEAGNRVIYPNSSINRPSN